MTRDVIRIGVDLGGTKIEAIALDAAGETLARRRVATPADDYAAIIDAVATLVREIEFDIGRRGVVGVGAPGAISTHTGLVKNSNTAVVNGKPLDVDLAQALGRPVRVANDANCFALSEAIDGAGRGAGVVFGVILGTGVGGGVIVNGKILEGRNRVAGEWGHTPLPWMTAARNIPGAPAFAGTAAASRRFFAAPAFRATMRSAPARAATAAEIAALAEAGDPAARASLDCYQDRLARALAVVVDLIDPDVIVLGGGLSNISRLYEGLAARVGENAVTDAFDTKILPNAHGNSGGVRGAAWLWAPARPNELDILRPPERASRAACAGAVPSGLAPVYAEAIAAAAASVRGSLRWAPPEIGRITGRSRAPIWLFSPRARRRRRTRASASLKNTATARLRRPIASSRSGATASCFARCIGSWTPASRSTA